MSDFITQKSVQARKEHRCGECGGFIQAGCRYMIISGAMEGQGFSHKRCGGCHHAFTWIDLTLRLGPYGMPNDEGIEFGALRAELAEYASESRFTDPESLKHLHGMAERRRDADLVLIERGAA